MFSARPLLKKEIQPTQFKIEELGQEKERVKTQVLGASKENSESSRLLNDIFSFNSQVGKGLLLCFQNQMYLAQVFMELIQGFEDEKHSEYFSVKSNHQTEPIKMGGETYSYQSYSHQQHHNNKDRILNLITSKIEKITGDLSSILSPFQPGSTEPSVETHKYQTATPPISYRNWAQDVKRSSVPVVVNSSQDYNGSLYSKNQQDYGINMANDNRRASTDSAQLLTGLKNSNPVGPVTSANVTIDSKNLKRFLQKKQASLNKNNPSSIGAKLSPRYFEELKDKPKFIHYQEDAKTSTSAQVAKPVAEKERQSIDKFTTKAAMGLIPRKELAEESIDQNGDRTLNSSASSNVINNETDRMFRLQDLEENSLIMNLNNVKEVALKEKEIIKGLLKEELNEMTSKMAKVEHGKVNEKRNLINAKWWRSWKEYVNFDCDNDAKSKKGMNIVPNLSGIIAGIYPRPGRINNRSLLKYEIVEDFGLLPGDLELKENLLEHHDYEIVTKKVFDNLSRWYGCDFEIVRPLKVDQFRNNKLCLDLYPGKSGEMKGKNTKLRTTSPQANLGAENVISSIIHTNLSNFQGKSRYDSKNAH